MSHAIIQIDETISSDNWSHVTRGDGLNKMVQDIQNMVCSESMHFQDQCVLQGLVIDSAWNRSKLNATSAEAKRDIH